MTNNRSLTWRAICDAVIARAFSRPLTVSAGKFVRAAFLISFGPVMSDPDGVEAFIGNGRPEDDARDLRRRLNEYAAEVRCPRDDDSVPDDTMSGNHPAPPARVAQRAIPIDLCVGLSVSRGSE